MKVKDLIKVLEQCDGDTDIEAFYSQYNGSDDEVEYMGFDVFMTINDTLRIVPHCDSTERSKPYQLNLTGGQK